MAGGAGSRLRPLTSNQPKPMVPLANRPLMEHIIHLLRRHGFTDIVVTVQFLASMVRQYFGDGSDLGVQLTYATEDSPLGTAGSVKNAEEALSEGPFLVISGDALTDLDLQKVLAFHEEKGAMVTVVLSRQENPLEYGIVVTGEDGRIERFLEKPGWGQVFTDTVNTGIYVLDPAVFAHIPEGEPFDFSKDLFPKLLDEGAALYGFVADGYWCDVGTIGAYRQAQRDALDGKVEIEIPGFEIADGVRVGDTVDIHATAVIEGPALIGDHVRIEAGARVREYSIIGANVTIGTDATLHRTTIADNAHVGRNASLRGAIVGRGGDVRANVIVDEGCVIGDQAVIGEGATLAPDVKVYPHKRVEAGATVARSIIWETVGARTLFGRHGVSGLVNIDIGPDVAVRLGAAFASILPRGTTVVAARDASRAARTIKRALIAGLNGAGADVEDLEIAPAPLLRNHVRASRAGGGVLVACVPGDARSLSIRFIAAEGDDLPEEREREIDRVYFRDDARRAFVEEIGELRYPPRALEFYQSAILRRLDLDTLRRSGLKSVIDAASGPASFVLPGLIGRLGTDTLTRNAAIDEQRPTIADADRSRLLDELADLVRASRADLGVLIEPTAESFHVVAEGGLILDRQQQALLLADLVWAATPDAVVCAPVSITRCLEELADQRRGTLVRTPRDPAALLAAARQADATLALTANGGAAFLRLTGTVDAIASTVALHELLARSGAAVGSRLATLPRPRVQHRAIPTPWERKGAVMRAFADRYRGKPTTEIDGLGVDLGDAWILVAPDPDHALTEIWAESTNEARALSLLEEAAVIVQGTA